MEALDASLVRVPFEALKRAAKERKSLVDDASAALARLDGLADVDPQTQQQGLADLEQCLHGLKRKLTEVGKQEQEEAQRCKARLDHLDSLGAPPANGAVAWNKQRLDRMLVDHLLRSGHYQAAANLAKACGCEMLAELRAFEAVQPVVAALRAGNCGPALAWCSDNRARLKKIKSTLEFKLRLQEFLELVRQDRRLDALYYARRHLAPWAPTHMAELSCALATLALTARTKAVPYKQLFEPSQWAGLLSQLRRDLYRLHAMPHDSQLEVHLQAGLVALKTPRTSLAATAAAAAPSGKPCSSSKAPSAAAGASGSTAAAVAAAAPPAASGNVPSQGKHASSSSSSSRGGNKDDPLHLPAFQALAEGLPYAKHAHSKLICSVTAELMTDANPPMVLPNGCVYSQKAIAVLVAKHGGKVVCPQTGQEYGLDELRRAFIV